MQKHMLAIMLLITNNTYVPKPRTSRVCTIVQRVMEILTYSINILTEVNSKQFLNWFNYSFLEGQDFYYTGFLTDWRTRV